MSFQCVHMKIGASWPTLTDDLQLRQFQISENVQLARPLNAWPGGFEGSYFFDYKEVYIC